MRGHQGGLAVLTLRLHKQYREKVKPWPCANLDCRAPMEPPVFVYAFNAKVRGRKKLVRAVLCCNCAEVVDEQKGVIEVRYEEQ
jgi:hypothetical protein